MSLVATRLQNWRIANPELDRNMFRPLEYGALDFFIEQTDAPNSIISPNTASFLLLICTSKI